MSTDSNTTDSPNKRERSTIRGSPNAIGFTKELTERINEILKILEPIMLPNAISDSFFLAADKHAKSSGNEVPIATTIKDIKDSEMFKI